MTHIYQEITVGAFRGFRQELLNSRLPCSFKNGGFLTLPERETLHEWDRSWESKMRQIESEYENKLNVFCEDTLPGLVPISILKFYDIRLFPYVRRAEEYQTTISTDLLSTVTVSLSKDYQHLQIGSERLGITEKAGFILNELFCAKNIGEDSIAWTQILDKVAGHFPDVQSQKISDFFKGKGLPEIKKKLIEPVPGRRGLYRLKHPYVPSKFSPNSS
jgi:hypothetical protein